MQQISIFMLCNRNNLFRLVSLDVRPKIEHPWRKFVQKLKVLSSARGNSSKHGSNYIRDHACSTTQ